jgi:hypothetical protein
MQKPKYIWDGSVGACVREKTESKNRQTFYTFEFTRCFTRGGSSEFEYSNSFTARHADQLRNVLDQTLLAIAELEAESPQPRSAEAA